MPRSTHEVADEVRKAAADGLTVRMAGTGHSFTPVAATDGVLLHPGGMTSISRFSAVSGTPTHCLNVSESRRRSTATSKMAPIVQRTTLVSSWGAR